MNRMESNEIFDWASEENLGKWRGLFVTPLKKVLQQVHPQFTAKEDALDYVENLLFRLLAMLTAKPAPLSTSDVEKRVSDRFPNPLGDLAKGFAKEELNKSRRKSTIEFSRDKIHNLLKEVLHGHKVDDQVNLYLVAVLHYIASDILKVAGNFVKNKRHQVITCQDIKIAMKADKVLNDLFYPDDGMNHVIDPELEDDTKEDQSYDEVVKKFIMAERRYVERDLYMITKVFRDFLAKRHIATPTELEAIYSNINYIIELTLTLIGSLEDTLEMTEEGLAPAVGTCFEELAEAEEFEVYEKYTRDILDPSCRKTLDTLLGRPEVIAQLTSPGKEMKGMKEAFKFYLPKLLLVPVYHCLTYYKKIQKLIALSQNQEDIDSLTQAVGMHGGLEPLATKLTEIIQNADSTVKRNINDIRSTMNKVSRQVSLQKMEQLQKSITQWKGKDIASNSKELFREGKLKETKSKEFKKYQDRYVFLLDGMIIICKQQERTNLTSAQHGTTTEYKLHKKFLIPWVSVIDDIENDDQDVMFAIIDNNETRVTFKTESPDEKRSWMAVLVMLTTKSLLERTLDDYETKEEKKHPLRFPSGDVYKFTEANSTENIVFEENDKTSGVSHIKGATLVKLVERLTHHVYADPMFMKTFLTTYRSFCTPDELLDLLIQRFTIPDPEFSSDSESDSEMGDKSSKMRMALDMKKFREQYSQPVQFRVLNVLKHWVDQHFYDFQQDNELLHKLNSFLDTIAGKSMKKWVEIISKNVQRRLSNEECNKSLIFDKKPPDIEVHIVNADTTWPGLLTYHPIEIARQLTLLEFQYYRAVKPSELVDMAWVKDDKDKRSPNLLKMTRHINNLTRYIERLIVDTPNQEERHCVIVRTLEILVVLHELHNFNGVLALTSALTSAAVNRIMKPLKENNKLPNNLQKALKEGEQLTENHCALYWNKLRSINPPTVPYFGPYQTQITLFEEGNPDCLPNTALINFSKRRKVADIIAEIQQYQNQPYCLNESPEIQQFLKDLNPFPNMEDKEIRDELWKKSLEVEPRDSSQRKPDGKRLWPGLNLRSPGIKKGRGHPPGILPKIRQSTENDSPTTSPNYSGPNTPLAGNATSMISIGSSSHANSINSMSTSPPELEEVKVACYFPKTPTQTYQPNNSLSYFGSSNHSVNNGPPLPHKPRKSEPRRQDESRGGNQQQDNPPPLPPRISRQTPTHPSQPSLPPRPRGVLEARSPHMDPVDSRRENKFVTNCNYNPTVQSSPPILPPRRHSNVTNGSHQGQRYPPPPLSLRAGSEGTSPSSYSPGLFDTPALPQRGAPPLSASARLSTTQHFDLNNSVGAMSITPSSSTSGGGGGTRSHFVFNDPGTPPPPPRPPPHRPPQVNSPLDL